MRLIDADSLKERMFAEIPEHEKGVVDIFLEAVAAMIDEQPTIERKTGKWMHDKDDELFSGYCSCCGWESVICETDVAGMPYCPNCGAYMRGEADGQN